MKAALHILLIIVAAFVIGCSGCKPVPTPDPETDIDRCDDACAHLQELGCEEGNPISMPDGSETSCTQFCIDTAKAGHWLNPRCLETVESCDEEVIEACGVHTEETVKE